jgi:sugar phosphate isomerase/epimerase
MGDNGIYKGGNYRFQFNDNNGSVEDPFVEGGGTLSSNLYRVKAGNVGLATDVRTANQLDEVSKKLSSGAKTIEVSAIQSQLLEAIPKQHFEELARLKKLVGAELTFHGPLIEPTGVTQNGWDEATRQQAERQLSEAVLRSHQLNPDGNTVVTLHTSNGLPSPSLRLKQPGTKGDGEITNIAIINERTGEVGYLPKHLLEPDNFTGEKRPTTLKEFNDKINEFNKSQWTRELNEISIETMRGREEIKKAMTVIGEEGADYDDVSDLYKAFCEDKNIYAKKISMYDDHLKNVMHNRMEQLHYGENFIRGSYAKFKDMYNKAYASAEKTGDEERKNKLEEYKKKTAVKIESMRDDPLKIKEFSEEVTNGIDLVSGLYKKGDEAPAMFKPLQEFAVEKASETFGNVAFNAYAQYKDKAPIISIENPPVGMGMSRADEIVQLVKATREHFIDRVVKEEGLSKEEAKAQAEKLIGVTWDVGHINMIRKYGYGDEDLIKETKQVKDYVKHIHLSDNFGLEHTELPMGMGNVPLKEHLAELGEKAAKAKQIIETGDWYQHFKSNPLPEVLHALGSPIYPMQMQPSWNEAEGMSGRPNYFSGYGYNPDIHHSIYGSGFSGLPTELGGQMQGGRSRLGGAPME